MLAGAAHAQERSIEDFALKPGCERVTQTGQRRCWTSTKGYGESTPSAHIADLGFARSTTGRELLSRSFHAHEGAAFAVTNVTLAVRRAAGPLRSVPSAARGTRGEDDDETLAYLYAAKQEHVEEMLSAMRAYRPLAIGLTYRQMRQSANVDPRACQKKS